jgi:hypothetical protein
MELDRAFQSTIKTLLGESAGELTEFNGFLSRYVEPLERTVSTLTNKPVFLGANYRNKSKVVSQDEMLQLTQDHLDINKIKDIDSTLNAVKERFYYSGNKFGGQYREVAESDECYDVFFIEKCKNVYESQYASHCQMVKNSKYVFGCSWGVEATSCVNVSEMFRVSRIFESTMILHSADVYYSYNCKNCHDVMFCLNQRSKRYSIGNNVLEREKYFELKKKLISELHDRLRTRKTLPPHIDLFCGVIE